VIWAVYNGYLGEGAVCALVYADNEKSAFEQAVDAFADDDKRPAFSTPNPRWRAELIHLPYVCELS
jgi:hypothetical protein